MDQDISQSLGARRKNGKGGRGKNALQQLLSSIPVFPFFPSYWTFAILEIKGVQHDFIDVSPYFSVNADAKTGLDSADCKSPVLTHLLQMAE